MARVVVLGGGVAGHTTATFAKKWLGKEHASYSCNTKLKWELAFHQIYGSAAPDEKRGCSIPTSTSI